MINRLPEAIIIRSADQNKEVLLTNKAYEEGTIRADFDSLFEREDDSLRKRTSSQSMILSSVEDNGETNPFSSKTVRVVWKGEPALLTLITDN